jgi:Flp pilus assembly protein TadG
MRIHRKKSERGFVLITMTASAIAVIAAVGLAVDMGHVYIVKNETQTFADAAALAGALKLDGTSTGISNAQSAVTAMTSNDKYNFATTAVISPTVYFTSSTAGAGAALACSGTWTTSPSTSTSINCVKVALSVTVPVYFIPVSMLSKSNAVVYGMVVNSQAVAAQVDLATLGTGLAPYSGIIDSPSATGPNFGLVVGDEYNIQWPAFNSTNNGCKQQTPDNCFNGTNGNGKNGTGLCQNESNDAEWAVVSNWSASNSGYWGTNSGSVLESYVLGGAQLQAVSVGTNLTPVLSSGQKNAEAIYLDWKVNNDTDSMDNSWGAYNSRLTAKTANGSRLIDIPILSPTSTTTTTVVGYGQYLLESNASSSKGVLTPSNLYETFTGNQGWCAIYVGPLVIGGFNPGVGGSTGAAQVQLIQ